MSIFTKVPMRRPPSNIFDLSHDVKMSIPMKTLIPFLALECIPNDHFRIQDGALVRFAPMVAPPMHVVSVYTHYFFVPNRILWQAVSGDSGWEDFISGGQSGISDPSVPFVVLDDTSYDTFPIMDYMGLPDPQGATVNVSALPFAAYQFIWNEYYRDQNLQNEVVYEVTDGNNSSNTDLLQLRKRSWMHDYFTSALPWTQKGPEATIPLGATADLNIPSTGGLVFNPGESVSTAKVSGDPFAADDLTYNASAAGLPVVVRVQGETGTFDVTRATSIDPAVNVDLSTATAASINDLRTAFRLQEWLEVNARSGTRYTEFIYAHFGVKNPDARLQRPEFIGGSANPVSFSEVLQTSGSNISGQSTPQGNMAGHGISAGGGRRNSYHVKEHGYIIGIMSVMPKTGYFQGIPRHFIKTDRFEYYFKQFAHIGEQPIYNKELYVANDGENDGIFGYTPRYAEYKYIPSRVAGSFKTTLDFWHMARKFGSRPALNEVFLTEDDDINRIFVDTETTEQLYCHVYLSIKARRPMPYFGEPRGI